MEPGRKATEDFNRKCVAHAEEDMAPVEPDTIKYGSLSCGYTNQGLRANGAGCKRSNPQLGDGVNHCVDKIAKHDTGFARLSNMDSSEWCSSGGRPNYTRSR